LSIFDINNTLATIFEYQLSYVEFIGTFFGLISVWLAAKQNIGTWPTGLMNVICFFAIFYQVHLYSDMFLQVYFFITSIYGWITWKNQRKLNKPISLLSNTRRISLLILISISTLLFGILVKNIHVLLPNIFIHPASYPFLDTFIAVCSIIATLLLAKRILENWILWIVVDIICVYVYTKKHILFISIEYGVFFLLASYGLFLWIKLIKNDNRVSFG
jgi:nicotinamide mononucleotide transporter